MSWRALDYRQEVDKLLRLVRRCHPDRLPRQPLMYWVNPTMVFVRPTLSGREQMVAYQSCTLAHDALLGQDLGVDPDFRGRGLGHSCLTVRESIARALGCKMMTGQTQGSNAAMIACFQRAGYMLEAEVAGLYTDLPGEPVDGYVYTKSLVPSDQEQAEVTREVKGG